MPFRKRVRVGNAVLRGSDLVLEVDRHTVVQLTDESGAVVDHWEMWPSRAHKLTFHILED